MKSAIIFHPLPPSSMPTVLGFPAPPACCPCRNAPGGCLLSEIRPKELCLAHRLSAARPRKICRCERLWVHLKSQPSPRDTWPMWGCTGGPRHLVGLSTPGAEPGPSSAKFVGVSTVPDPIAQPSYLDVCPVPGTPAARPLLVASGQTWGPQFFPQVETRCSLSPKRLACSLGASQLLCCSRMSCKAGSGFSKNILPLQIPRERGKAQVL